MCGLVDILKDIASGKRNSLGDYWHSSYIKEGATKICELEKEVVLYKELIKVARPIILGWPCTKQYKLSIKNKFEALNQRG